MSIQEKSRRLRAILESYGRLVVAFSGGIDSAFLLKTAVETLGGKKVLAATALAVNFSRRESGEAADFARELGADHLLVEFDPLGIDEFSRNTPDRCYHCKKALFSRLWELARERGFSVLADGANLDDVGDYRPGMKAVRELAVSSPLLEAGLGKRDIRRLALEGGLPFWDKPSMACLASRIPYGLPIDGKRLAMVEEAEGYLLDSGFRNIRVRHHGDLARIETETGEMAKLFDRRMMERVDARLKEIGFGYVALDLLGYRTGSLNEAILGGAGGAALPRAVPGTPSGPPPARQREDPGIRIRSSEEA